MSTATIVNQAIPLYRDDPVFNSEISAATGFPWRCDIWQKTVEWPLFATTWGKTNLEARAKANSVIQACAVERWTDLSGTESGACFAALTSQRLSVTKRR